MYKNNNILFQRELKEFIHLPLVDDMEKKYGFFIINVNVTDGSRDDFLTAPAHRYDFWCLSHIFSGKGNCCLEGKGDYELCPGTAVIVAPGERNIVGGNPMQGYREDFITFGGTLFEKMHQNGLLESGCYKLGVQRRLPALAKILHNPLSDSYWQCGIMLQELLLEIHRNRQITDSTSPITELLKKIQDSPEADWSLQKIAKHCYRSTAQTRRLFLQYTGLAPKAYVEKVKFQRAQELLTNTSMPIDEIAHSLHFQDRFHFSRRFKALLGVTPAYFRQHGTI